MIQQILRLRFVGVISISNCNLGEQKSFPDFLELFSFFTLICIFVVDKTNLLYHQIYSQWIILFLTF